SAHVLQPVGEGGEVYVGVNSGENVHGLGDGSIDEILPLHDLLHPPQQLLLVAAVVVEGEVLVASSKPRNASNAAASWPGESAQKEYIVWASPSTMRVPSR